MPSRMVDPLAAADSTDDLNRDDAFGRMLVSLQPRLRAFLKNLSRCDADDLVQESITRAWRSRATFDANRGDPEAWLMRIGFRAFLDQRAASKPTHPLDPAPTAEAPGPSDQAAARENLARLLETLSDRERDILLRFHRDGESIAAIAHKLKLPTGTVKSHLRRARARLWAIKNNEELK